MLPNFVQSRYIYGVMTTKEIAEDLVSLCQADKSDEAMRKHYSAEIVSVEAMGDQPESLGLAAVIAKGEWWMNNHEVHSAQAEGPYMNGDGFAVRFKYDVTFKQSGKRFVMDEVAVYQVAEGKIVHERFYYTM